MLRSEMYGVVRGMRRSPDEIGVSLVAPMPHIESRFLKFGRRTERGVWIEYEPGEATQLAHVIATTVAIKRKRKTESNPDMVFVEFSDQVALNEGIQAIQSQMSTSK